MKKYIVLVTLLTALAVQSPAQAAWYSYPSAFVMGLVSKTFQTVTNKVAERPALAIPVMLGALVTCWLANKLIQKTINKLVNLKTVLNPYVVVWVYLDRITFDSARKSPESKSFLLENKTIIISSTGLPGLFRGYLSSAPNSVQEAWKQLVAAANTTIAK